MGPFCKELEKNIRTVEEAFFAPENKDLKTRRFLVDRHPAALLYLEGMCDEKLLGELVLRCNLFDKSVPVRRLQEVAARAVAVAGVEEIRESPQALRVILDGQALLFLDGLSAPLALDARGYEKRTVSPPATENVVLGSQEGFTENLRTNVTLIRRMTRTPALISAVTQVGKTAQVTVCVMYIHGAADPLVVQEVQRRLARIDMDILPGAGFLSQLIEDDGRTLVPQTILTERPDRASSFLREGQVLLVCDGAPFVVAVPVTFFHFFNTPDDTFTRWQHGSFMRLIRYMGLFFALFLPGIYLSLTMHHQELLPPELLLAIIDARADVPLPVFAEILMMQLFFLLIDQSSTRIPKLVGGVLGIFGALILGDAAITAKLVSPVPVIIVALTALGSYAIPDIQLNSAVQLLQFAFTLAGAAGGFFGMSAALVAIFVPLCRVTSFGVPFFAPIAPKTGHNPDLFLRHPLRSQRSKDSTTHQ